MAAKCVKKSLAHYEDETVIGLASILHATCLHHNLTIRKMLVRSERLLSSQLLESMRKLLKEFERLCIISIGEYTPSVPYLGIHHVLSNLCP